MNDHKHVPVLTLLAICAMIGLAACGTGAGAGEPIIEKVNPTANIYSVDDFETAGFKVVKNYNVEGLTGASAAIYGFLRAANGLEPQSYELRFYDTHDDAVRLGTGFAEEVTGEGAVLIKSEMLWSEGSREQKEPAGEGGGAIAFYWYYAIYGNVVMLCEGDWPEQSLEVCAQLQKTLNPVAQG